MKGYIITNGFTAMPKMEELVFRFKELFLQKGVSAEIIKTNCIFPVINRDGAAEIKGIGKADFILFWDKDIMLARLLEKAGYRLFNRADAIGICDNKILTHGFLSGHGISMPETIQAPLVFEGCSYYDEKFVERAGDILGWPMVIKEAYGSFGQQVYLCRNLKEASEVIGSIKYKPYLFQKYISESAGKDIRIYVVGGKVAASMLRENKNDFRANISNGGKMSPVTPSEEYCDMAVNAANLIGLDYCGVDILIGKDYPMLCEVNSNAHFKNIQICTGIDVAEKFADFIIEKTEGIQ